jgi:CheY-like chemotaxis protein
MYAPLAVLWYKRGSDPMCAIRSEALPISTISLSTNFPIVPVEDVPASGMSVDTGALRSLVLVVDGEAAVANTLVEILDRSGYTAIAAYDGEGALENALLMPPELVITEAELPGMSGIELAIALKSEIPDCKILLLSGQEPTSDLPAPAGGKGHEFESLRKPIHPDDLVAHVSARLKPQIVDPKASD